MPAFPIGAWLSTSWSADDIVTVAREAEQAGFASISVADHFIGNTGTEEVGEGTMFECFALLAGIATAVPRVRLCSLVAGITYRHPAILANIAATIDALSGGRLVLGVGAGWQLNEHAAYGLALGPVRERIDRLEEGLEVLRGMLTQPSTTMQGKHYTVTGAPRVPAVQSRVPILIGAKGERRMLRVVAKHADEWNCPSSPEIFVHKSAILEEHCERIGRDPRSIRRSTHPMLSRDPENECSPDLFTGSADRIVDTIGRWREAGADEVLVPSLFWTADETRAIYARLQSEVFPQLA
ncbi:TIGR03560 family F420-dependent LLM class oxidoreductase [Amycolatopsis pigmentata]|uniref:TIGR03560 family F420-dependent LLM class oxidoreductase n=1 Tax=Amycolatopsis pigmentata TaxID=450801 RepID=A0ABW5FZR5_9PSEU